MGYGNMHKTVNKLIDKENISNVDRYTLVFQISAFKDINQIKTLIDFFSNNNTHHNIIILIHINKLTDKKIHEEILELSHKNTQIHIITPIIVKWSHISHVHQKIEGMKYLKDNSIKYDYYVCITGGDIPIKPLDQMINWIIQNIDSSYFFDYFSEINKYKQYFERLTEYKFSKRILKTFRILIDQINFSEYTLTHKWRWYFNGRIISENSNLSGIKKIIIKFFKYLWFSLHFVQIIKFYFNPTKKNYISAQKWQFGRKVKQQKLKIYSEWQYSITSFFSLKYCNFALENYEKYIDQFSDIYAPDESFWISLAKNFTNDVGTCVFNWKPMILGLENIFKPKNNRGGKLKLAWDYNNLHSVDKYNDVYVLFARSSDSYNRTIELMKYMNIIDIQLKQAK